MNIFLLCQQMQYTECRYMLEVSHNVNIEWRDEESGPCKVWVCRQGKINENTKKKNRKMFVCITFPPENDIQIEMLCLLSPLCLLVRVYDYAISFITNIFRFHCCQFPFIMTISHYIDLIIWNVANKIHISWCDGWHQHVQTHVSRPPCRGNMAQFLHCFHFILCFFLSVDALQTPIPQRSNDIY